MTGATDDASSSDATPSLNNNCMGNAQRLPPVEKCIVHSPSKYRETEGIKVYRN